MMPTIRAPKPITLPEAFARMRDWGYEDDQFIGLFIAWHDRGDAIILFANHDLSSLLSRPLGIAMPWDVPPKPDKWPPHAPDTEGGGLGWRYLPDLVVLPDGAVMP